MPMLSQGMVTPGETEGINERETRPQVITDYNNNSTESEEMQLQVIYILNTLSSAAKSVYTAFACPYQAQHPDASEWIQSYWGGQ